MGRPAVPGGPADRRSGAAAGQHLDLRLQLRRDMRLTALLFGAGLGVRGHQSRAGRLLLRARVAAAIARSKRGGVNKLPPGAAESRRMRACQPQG